MHLKLLMLLVRLDSYAVSLNFAWFGLVSTSKFHTNYAHLLDSKGRAESVHYILLPTANELLINYPVERQVKRMQEVCWACYGLATDLLEFVCNP